MRISAETSSLWINNVLYSKIKGAEYKCSGSKSCQGEETLEFLGADRNPLSPIWRTLVKEQVSFGGLTLPNMGVFMINSLPGLDLSDTNQYPGILGLDFKRANPKIPTIYEYLKAENLIEEPIVSMNLKDNDEGELIFGGYAVNKTRADFKFVQFLEENYPLIAKSSISTNGIGYSYPSGGPTRAVLDFEYPWIIIPQWSYNKIIDIINDHRLREGGKPEGWWHPDGIDPVKCEAINVLNDLIVEFEGFTLKIPASAYIIRAKGYYYNSFEESDEEGCFLVLESEFESRSRNIILGQPLFRAYDVIFDSETNSVGFSPKYEIDPSFNFIPYVILTISLACLVLLGFYYSFRAKKFAKPYMKFDEKGIELDESSLSVPQINVGIPVQSLPYHRPEQSLPYPVGYQNYIEVQSDDKIEEENES